MQQNKELLTAELYFTAVFPVLKILLKDDPGMNKRFKNVDAKVVFKAKNGDGEIGTTLCIKDNDIEFINEPIEKPDIAISFGSVEKMNSFLKGGSALPKIKGFGKPVLLFKFISLLLRMKLMMPDVKPKKPLEKYLKVKMALYMVSTALSKLNKSGNADMMRWTKLQPDRIYQLSVKDSDIAVYLRVKAGKTKAGRGLYKRKRPFVHMQFGSIDGAIAILLNEVEFVQGVGKGYVSIEGSPEYASNLNDFMMRIQSLTT
jgi:hypothetical protein